MTSAPRAGGFASPATGTHTLDARTFSGSIRVSGDGGSDVRVEAVTKVEAETAEALQAALREVVLETQEQGATVVVSVRDGERPACGESGDWRGPAWWDRRRYDATVTLTVQVPRAVRVRLCAVNGEEVAVSGIDGDFDVSNVNGRVRLDGMRGSGRATTVNGAIDASFAAAPRDESLFKTVNGAIAATFPRDLAAELRLKSFNGEAYTDFDTTRAAGHAGTGAPCRRAAVRLQAARLHQRARRRGRSRADVRHAQWRRAHPARGALRREEP